MSEAVSQHILDAAMPAIEGEIKLGDLVRCSLTKFTGVCYIEVIPKDSAMRMSLQPRGVDKKTGLPLKSDSLDMSRLELLLKDVMKVKAIPPNAFRNGDKVEHNDSDLEGVIVTEINHITGCAQFGVLSDKLNARDGSIANVEWIPAAALTMVEPLKSDVSKPDAREAKKKEPGCAGYEIGSAIGSDFVSDQQF